MTEVVMTQTPPVLQGPSEKERKYDRQLRLWAASGQAALESANLLLLNSGSGTVGVETLKNLVLPGIGRFTIVDSTVVSEADLGVNFFLDESSLGKMRSQCSTELLLELNPEVQGDWHPKSEGPLNLQDFLATSPTFTMIMYTFPIQPDDLRLLEAYGRQHKTPLVAIHSAGFYSYFRLHLPGAFPIVDTHPDETATTDLRLLAPWPELAEWARDMTRDMDGLDAHQHGHLPFVAILLHYLEEWRGTHDGANPSTYAEKTAFRSLVRDAQRRDNAEGGEENFEEAVAAVLKTVAPSTLPSSLREVFEYKRANPQEATSPFWIIADAVEQFYEKHNCLPVPGNVPDMKAQSDVYIKLQNLYKAKARRDVDEVLKLVQAAPGGRDVDPAEVELFCKNAAFVKLINASGGANGDADRLATVTAQEFENDRNAEAFMAPPSLLPIYLALRATSHVATPMTAEQIQAKVAGKLASRVTGAANVERWVADASREVARAGGGELHNVSALTGGMVAQEVIKIITKQYVPVDNTCVFDGIGSRCQVFRL
ncbi:NEDD8-activating enzyme E1 regulatory subunit [Coniochaeta hoffmannii]|uniref:NEDD8-activating enzyme E1 regulatory subunit n=1 Tax=Coniochaeta hoffmannii TaxID=91930 RepID=A0AA38VNW9_9PEZI|nr:NEDD8-activating enzyme E1 regulatory subunit [Coniochaeta hoffmannii]